MGRQRTFDEDHVLEQAMQLFWTKGFEHTSIQDVCEYAGVHRGSMYHTFGDKHELFLACLDRFRHTLRDRLFVQLEEPGDPREVLTRFFDTLIDRMLDENKQRRGCLIANTAMELAPLEPCVEVRVAANLLDMEHMFHAFLVRAQREGKLKSKHSLREMARFLVTTKQGLHVMAKTTTDRKMLEDACKVALSLV
ncbi:TetR/AcrR family transcriptional regulator [Paenibacillus filicis]|uniref:TetR/AcrR family transcriptional regulator n=1 Tax=Paenibacillus filicis TaxID=669464 RepID=A0ABU9DD75_9BACL